MKADMAELKEKAKKLERERQLRESRLDQTPFANDGFFESTGYYNVPDTGKSNGPGGD